MALARIENFGGIQPRVHPSLLQNGMAVRAHNVKLKNGKLVPLRMPSVASGVGIMLENGLEDVADAYTMHAWKRADGESDLVLFGGQTWMAPGNIADDSKTRVVLSGPGVAGGEPTIYMRDGARIVRLPMCKNPLSAPLVSRNGGPLEKFDAITMKGYLTCAEIDAIADAEKGDVYYSKDAGQIGSGSSAIHTTVNSQVVWLGDAWGFYDSAAFANIRYTYFFSTWVDAYGYESPVSEPSGEISYNDGDTMTVNVGELPDGADKVRIYKVVTGTQEGRIQFIKEVDARDAATPFAVSVKDEDAGEVISVVTSPPRDLRCVLDVPGGFYCGFSPSSPKTVMFSEVGLMYSWPDEYRYDVGDNVVALAVTSNMVFALTDGWPYVLSGTSPGGMSVTKLAGPAACVSERSVCVFQNAVYYASSEGLMTIRNSADAGTVCANLTDKIYTKDQWLAKNPSSCICGQHDGAMYLFFTHENGTHEGLRIDLTESAAAVTTHDEVAKCLCVDNKHDEMYFVREGV